MNEEKDMRGKNGFTLIELLIVISIIGVLAGLLFTNFSNARERTRDVKRKSDLTQMKHALRLYYNDYQKYPDASNVKIAGCGVAGISECEWGDTFKAGAGQTIYMNQLPSDPLDSQTYTYAKVSDDDFQLTASLENASDDSSATSQEKCGTPAVNVVARLYMVCAD